MRIRELSVTGLFGTFDHHVVMHLDERTTIIYGPNGYGKTVLLRLVDSLFNRKYNTLRSIPFKELAIMFDDASELRIIKGYDPRQLPFQEIVSGDTSLDGIIFQYRQMRSEIQFYVLNRTNKLIDRHFPMSIVDDFVPGLERIDRNRWIHLPTSEILTLDDVIERFSDRLPPSIARSEPEPDWLTEFRSAIPVRFIETQRLLSLRSRRASNLERSGNLEPAVDIYSVDIYSKELSRTIQSALAESASRSQSLDRTFPSRLVRQSPIAVLTVDDLKERLISLEAKRSRLKDAGLLDKDDDMIGDEPVQEQNRAVLSIYVGDVEEKLGIFDDLVSRIELLKGIVNRKFLYKKMDINKDTGFVFTSHRGDVLLPTSLSSGEQHELVLLYEFLFNVKPGSLILIDEPELSLHVDWQRQFLRDVQDIAKLVAFDMIIATHSPQIINNRFDLAVELKGPIQ